MIDGTAIDRARFALRGPPRLERSSILSAREIEVFGARLRVTDLGEGDVTYVVTPDPPNVLEHHVETFRRLAQGARVVGMELPGFGFSSVPRGFSFSIEANAALVLQALDQLRVRRAILVFPCVAGLVALEAARMDNDVVAGVVLCQTPSFDDILRWSRRVDFKGMMATPVVGQLLVRAARRKLARVWYDAALPKGVDRQPFLAEALHAYDRGADYCLASALQAVQRAEPPSSAVNVPVLSIWGALDRTHRHSDPAAVRALVPQLDVRVFEDAGHFPDLEQADRFVEEVLAFGPRVGA